MNRVAQPLEEVGERAEALRNLRASLRTLMTHRLGRLRVLYYKEVRRIALTCILALTAGFLIWGAVSIAALAVVLAFWETHRVLAAVLTSLGLAILAAVTLLLLRRSPM